MGYLTSIGFYVPDWNGLTITSLIFGLLLSISAIATSFTDTTPYSKFGNRPKLDTIPSKKAMLLIYVPSVLACFCIQPRISFTTHFDIVHALVTLHFVKRVLEVLFVHLYKSKTSFETVIPIMVTYAMTTVLDLLIVRRMPEVVFSQKWTQCGAILVIVGEIVSVYHHVLLRQLRTSPQISKKNYQLPRGGLFNYIVAPHYLAEQVVFLGFILLSQNIVTVALKLFPFIYLTDRARKTRAWYNLNLVDRQSKKDLQQRKNLIPFIW
ncbi:hypothetical protein INT47_002897 [Mucor saturninus]|uniref:3-oxo-5-alpha-steroid 4-dehydrogenase C-terminal domain-containing protein n=1 Tax=Mucor saturninus TaxID=64648 RepID=A0A8H7QQ51_9FUNG|nr:hypothetical protein INT47_002897 [Mucor saturninus]